MDRIFLTGQLKKDPVAGNKPETPSAWFIVKTSSYVPALGKRTYKDIMVLAFDKLALFVLNNLHKGSLIDIEGTLQFYQDKNGYDKINVKALIIEYTKTIKDFIEPEVGHVPYERDYKQPEQKGENE